MKCRNLGILVSALFICLALNAADTAYGKQNTLEISGQASIAYSNNTNPRLSSEAFYLGLQPTVAYFIADSWFLGTGIQANFNYNSIFSGWSIYGDYSLLGGKTFDVAPDFKLFGQIAVGAALPDTNSAGRLQTDYYFVKPTIGIKYLMQRVVITTGLSYSWTYYKYSFDPDFYAIHNVQLTTGIGFYF